MTDLLSIGAGGARAYQSALASYQTGNVDFATLLDAQRQIRQLRLSLLSLALEQRVQVVELERLVGAEL